MTTQERREEPGTLRAKNRIIMELDTIRELLGRTIHRSLFSDRDKVHGADGLGTVTQAAEALMDAPCPKIPTDYPVAP